MEKFHLAGAKKKARREGRTLVFLDESGLSERPYRVRTWAVRGHTPVLQHTFSWERLAVIAGLTGRNFYFQVRPGTIRAPQVVDFLKHLRRHLRAPLLVLWDGAPIHRAKLVRAYLESLHGAIHVERLPAYAPEVNPVECLWGYWKRTELANFCPKNLWELGHFATQALRRLRARRRRPHLITAFFHQAELW
jgi:transposase